MTSGVTVLPVGALNSFSLLANLEAGCTNPGLGFLCYNVRSLEIGQK